MEDPSDVAPVLPGETLAGKYRVERILGKGGMGIVLAARHLELEERVAIKFLIGERAPAAIERFLREAKAAAKVKSEHVCRVYDVGRLESGEPYMVLEHLEGIDLGMKLEKEERLPVTLVASAVIEACAALSEAHAIGIVHRDLKPANIFLADRPDGSTCVKVLDFGISKVPSTNEMTSTAVMMGSPLYMSPEQIASSKDVDARSDIWSLGVVLFELVSGSPPFVADSVFHLAIQVREQPPRALAELVQNVPEGFETIIQKCLAKQREDRYASVKELALDLAKFATPEAAHLATRLGGTPRSGRSPSHSDPALMATARETPSERALRVATPPNRTPPSSSSKGDAPVAASEPEKSPESDKGEKLGRATFAGLQTTTRERQLRERRRVRFALPAIAVLAIVGVVFGATRLRGSTPATPATGIVSAADHAEAPSASAFASAPPSVATNIVPAPSTSGEAHVPVAAIPTSHATARHPSHPKAAASAPAETTSAPATAAVATPAPTASAPEPPATRKKRALDRDDPY